MQVSWPHVVLGLIGCGISFYSLLVHQRIKAGEDSGCGFTETINCDKVLSSQYAEFLNIPLGIWGMLFFAVVILTAINSKSGKQTPLQIATWQLAVAGAGILTSLVLLYVSKVILKAYCPVCLATHATTITLFVVSLAKYLKQRKLSVTGGTRVPEVV